VSPCDKEAQRAVSLRQQEKGSCPAAMTLLCLQHTLGVTN